MEERHKLACAVWLLLTRLNSGKREVLFQKRQNTGYMDGKFDIGCSGHLDPDETISTAIVREAKEELGILVREEDLELATVVHDPEDNYIRFFFKTDKYEGVPTIMEPEKCSELIWAPIDNPPEETIGHIKLAIENICNGVSFDDGNLFNNKRL